MQIKHLIIIAVAGIVILVGFNSFNSFNSYRHEQNRAAASSQIPPANSPENNQVASSADSTSQPLGEQPKAMMDKATTQIDDAQQASQERVAQMDNAQ